MDHVRKSVLNLSCISDIKLYLSLVILSYYIVQVTDNTLLYKINVLINFNRKPKKTLMLHFSNVEQSSLSLQIMCKNVAHKFSV